MATEEGVHEAHQVSEAFVEQYYHIVGKVSQEAHKLYVAASVVSRPGPDGTMTSFTSLEAIDKHFLSCDSSTFEVLSVDSQSSLEEGIFIMVIGFLTGEDNLKRKFSQMFYLARQNTAYVVVNDIFRYVDEVSSTPTTLPAVVESVPETEVVEPVHAPTENSVNADVSEVKKAVAEAATPLDNGSDKHSAEKAVTAQKPKEIVADTAAPPVDGGKKSFAAMVASMARSSAPFQVKASPVVQKPKYMAAPKPREAAPAPKAPAAVSKRERKNDQRIVDEPGTSIFVSNLPMDAMPPQLYELFKEFGPIKEHGVQVRSSNARGTCFGFVAFETVASVQSVLEAAKNNAFKLGDRKLRVKEKQVEYDGSKPSGGKRTENGSAADGSKTENGSAADAEDDFKPIRSRRNRSEKKGNGNNEKNSVQTTPKPKA
ncbi:nuclear transport factor 2 [Brassica rapa]|uniref:nuclear transport factor 2 n=1 Tax=Brassica campestris TaxID=3711 RepID=UPI0004F146F0|nr:nuclear transport factor 2 [Brassica rapa]